MEFSLPGSRRHVLAPCAALLLALLAPPRSAFAYNAFSHSQITRNAFSYLRDHAHAFTETDRWIGQSGQYQGLMEEALVRATVDTDFKTDVWMDAIFHHPFTGAKSGNTIAMFTRMLHFVDVTQGGRYWKYDGLNYDHSSHEGNDGYLDEPTLEVRGNLSRAFGGENPQFPEHGYKLGPYYQGFQRSIKEWRNLYFGDADADETYMPPANVPAQLAFDALLKTDRATADLADSWEVKLPLVSGIFSTAHYNRHYWRGEIKGLPRGLDLLGITLHMTQDVTIPQHDLGTMDMCHQELEDLMDEMDCGVTKPVSTQPFDNGSFGGDSYFNCHKLYDERLVADILARHQELDPTRNMSVSDRIVTIAQVSSLWMWGEPDNDDFLGTWLPDGRVFTGDHCSDLTKEAAVHEWAKYQYNYAVAASVTMVELAAHGYEVPRETLLRRLLPAKLFNFFNLP